MSGLIKEEDLKVVKALAEKYGLSVNNFAKELLKNKERKQLIIRVTLDEVALLNKKVKGLEYQETSMASCVLKKQLRTELIKKSTSLMLLHCQKKTERKELQFRFLTGKN